MRAAGAAAGGGGMGAAPDDTDDLDGGHGGEGEPADHEQQRQHPQELDPGGLGCLAGDGYCFISYRGDVTPCGYFPVVAGNVRRQPFREIYLQSPLFCSLRNLRGYSGKCGVCEFLRVCGGCRARAYSLTGDYLAEEPYCIYQPRQMAGVKA